jgi:uncharacterized membrane protein (DUF485 family)
MLFRKEGNKVYIKYNKENHKGYFFGIISICVFGISVIKYFENITFESNFLNEYMKSNFVRIILIIGIIVFFIVSIMNKIFYSDYEYYLDLKDENIHLVNGIWKFKEEHIINFDKIKKIVIIKTKEIIGRNENSIDIYKIDIYDESLNAYEIYNSSDYEAIQKITLWLNSIIKKEIIEKINIYDYEGFRKRIK